MKLNSIKLINNFSTLKLNQNIQKNAKITFKGSINEDSFEKSSAINQENKTILYEENGRFIETESANEKYRYTQNPYVFLDTIRFENPQKKYITLIDGKFAKEEIKDNKEAQDFAKDVLENLAMTKFLLKHNRKEFIELFCEETGFPDLKTVRKNMESEITNAIHKLAKQNDFDVCFIGYDKNCSMGRTMALPGRDCDGLFMIIDTSKHKDKPWLAAATRWQFKDIVNQRILNTPAGSLPEVLSLDFIEDGLNLADYAYKKENFTKEDLARFSANIKDDSKDFVKCAEFNLRLVKHLKNDIETRDKFYKTSMFVELVRSGCILENNLPDKLMEKIKKSPLYQFSNLQRQEAFENIPKEKHLKRIEFLKDFDNLSTEKQFEIIKDMIYSSLHIRSAENEGLFVNINSKGEDEMGNILEMYDLLMNTPCID